MANESPDDRPRPVDAHLNDVIDTPTRVPPIVKAPEALPLRALPLRALRELLDHDEDALQEVLARFLDSLADVRVGVRSAIEVQDIGALAFQAHRFKSAAGQIDAAECYRLCSRLNDLTRDGDPAVLLEAELLVPQLLVALDQLERDVTYTMDSLTT